jgi:hypothetical protein
VKPPSIDGKDGVVADSIPVEDSTRNATVAAATATLVAALAAHTAAKIIRKG